LIVANNLMTMGALQALRSMAISVPGQISVIGFDDIALAELLNPPLTVVDRPMMQQGVLAMRLLSRCIRSEVTHEAQDIILETRLTKRGSCAPMGGAQGRKG
jgi:LacI family transcriptional regulator